MSRPVSIYRSLLSSLLLVILLLSAAILAVTVIQARRAVRALSRSAIEQSLGESEADLRLLFQPPVRSLLVLRDVAAAGALEFPDMEAFVARMAPLIERHPQVTSLMLADDRGREWMLLHDGEVWKTRDSWPDEWKDRTVWTERADPLAAPRVQEKEFPYDCRTRPWFQQATSAGPRWTVPYRFYTTKDVGITVSIRVPGPGDGTRVLGFDLKLDDISRFTMRMRPTPNGRVCVLTTDGHVLGLPGDPRFDDHGVRTDALLATPDAIGVAVVRDASAAVANEAEGSAEPVRFESDGEPWWVGRRRFPLGEDRSIVLAVLVPESDFLGDMRRVRLSVILASVAVLGFAALYAIRLARRYSEPMSALVGQTRRIRSGDLEPGAPIPTGLREVRALADAHDEMRVGLRTLMKLERDLQIARQIQQNTFPDALPRIEGFEIDAWSEPADETGGDTYDLVGLRREHRDGATTSMIVPEDSDSALLLVADATGHGIGPALSVTQVRAMLRMAARTGESLERIVEPMNQQLFADLADDRFITAWFGVLDGPTRSLTSFSAGQGPLLHYVAAEGAFRDLGSDAPPLGILEDLPIRINPPIRLEPGDLFLVPTDGFFEAKAPDRSDFGIDRLKHVVEAYRHRSPEEILAALRRAVDEFTGGAPPDDDRTAILIKRV